MSSFNHEKLFQLQLWMEIVGLLQSIESKNGFLILEIGNFKLTYNTESSEALCLKEQINHSLIGKKIAVLRTDSIKKPLVVSLIT